MSRSLSDLLADFSPTRPKGALLAIVALAALGVVASQLSGVGTDRSGDAMRAERPASTTLAREGVWAAQRPSIPAMCYLAVAPSVEANADGVAPEVCALCHAPSQARPVATPTAAPLHFLNLDRDVASAETRGLDAYVASDLYPGLVRTLEARRWRGPQPGLANLGLWPAAFDRRGVARDGSGWASYRFAPHPTRWPSQAGAFADAALRLPAPFRQTEDGAPSEAAHLANLAILEAAILGRSAADTAPIDETALGVDLDGDGAIGLALSVAARAFFVGAAADVAAQARAFPIGTEFLLALRYADVADDGRVGPARRLREIRLLRKVAHFNPSAWSAARTERLAGRPETAPPPRAVEEDGLDTGAGWVAQGFIEGADGALRPQTTEELQACVGCHGGLGAGVDGVFSFPRKRWGAAGWGPQDLAAFDDGPQSTALRDEIARWRAWTGGGDPFAPNDDDDHDEAAADATPSALLTPSAARAEQLNAAYRAIAQSQSFLFGRDVRLSRPTRLQDRISADALSRITRRSPPTL